MIKNFFVHLLSLNKRIGSITSILESNKTSSTIMSTPIHSKELQRSGSINFNLFLYSSQYIDWSIQTIEYALQEIQGLEERNRELDSRLGSSLSNLSKKDVGGSQSMSDSHSALGARFKQFESDLYEISTSIYANSQLNQPPRSREEIKRSKAKIQYNLSKIILTDQLVHPDSRSYESEVEKITIRYLDISLEELNQSYVSAAIDNFRKEFSEILRNTFLLYIKQNMMDKSNIKLIQNKVERYLIQEKILCLQSEVSEIVKDGITLLTDILAADPPGRLWVEDNGSVFSSATSEDRSSRSTGNIEFTIFPGYSVGTHIYHRAIVFTEKSEQTQRDSSPIANTNLAETQNIQTRTELPEAKIERLEGHIKNLLSGEHMVLGDLDSRRKTYIEADRLIIELINIINTGKYHSDEEQKSRVIDLYERRAICYYCLSDFKVSFQFLKEVYSHRSKSNRYDQKTINDTYERLRQVKKELDRHAK